MAKQSYPPKDQAEEIEHIPSAKQSPTFLQNDHKEYTDEHSIDNLIGWAWPTAYWLVIAINTSICLAIVKEIWTDRYNWLMHFPGIATFIASIVVLQITNKYFLRR